MVNSRNFNSKKYENEKCISKKLIKNKNKNCVNRKFIIRIPFAVIVIVLITITAHFSTTSKNFENSKNPANTHEQESNVSVQPAEDSMIEDPSTEEPIIEDPIAGKIGNMTLEEKIGQMVIAGLEGYTMDDNTRTLIEKYRVSGFILFNRNVENANQLLRLIKSLKDTNAAIKNSIPLFISVDEEGGRVSRMPSELKKLPSSSILGQINDEALSYKIGQILAAQLKIFGFNMNFAPVLDINSNPENPVIGERSFGPDPQIVGKLGIKTMKGIRNGGIIPVVKHFPGHGDTAVDSHIGMPVVEHDIERLRDFELIPFEEAIENEADAVMVAHILLNKIDPVNPASLSKTIITGILREQLCFEGVVITDDMTMGAISKNYSIGDASVMAIGAGSDIVLVCHGYDKVIEVIESIKKAVDNGMISEERINESVYRILKLKEKYKISDGLIETTDHTGYNQAGNTGDSTRDDAGDNTGDNNGILPEIEKVNNDISHVLDYIYKNYQNNQ